PAVIDSERDPELLCIAKPAAKAPQPEKTEAPKDEQKKADAPKANPGAKFNPSDLKAAWKAWSVLKKDHATHVYSPHYCRLYQETLLRYEQLRRAGDPSGKADTLKKTLDLL